jgi:hypothetical protein
MVLMSIMILCGTQIIVPSDDIGTSHGDDNSNVTDINNGTAENNKDTNTKETVEETTVSEHLKVKDVDDQSNQVHELTDSHIISNESEQNAVNETITTTNKQTNSSQVTLDNVEELTNSHMSDSFSKK